MRVWLVALVVALTPVGAFAQTVCDGQLTVCLGGGTGFALIQAGKPATVFVDGDAARPVARVAGDFASDLQKVSGQAPIVVHDLNGVSGPVVIIGQLGHSPLIDAMAADGRLDVSGVSDTWEAYVQQVVDNPAPGIVQALVIAGADPRGTIYGTYDISTEMGVSPWYWWADVPVAHQTEVRVTAGSRVDYPSVKYRGFFLNDEEPALGGWAREKFGGLNHEFYGHVFELDLRLKGNYLWPAMWGKAIADDDPESLKTADDYGIVLGTSHHEPMTRAQDEWHRHADGGITGGKWDYTKNAANLRTFWKGGIERSIGHDMLITVGMRGDGDEPMTEGTATQLLEAIVTDQRQIIADVTGKPASETPQVWALYKEVQNYYDHGMKAPDDVTLLFSDDNWGQIRRLPSVDAPERAGGYGVYYHFDYVGGPRNYKWLNTNQIEKVWQQMDLAWESGVDRVWIVNVGDLKPVEYPLSFFLDMAWNPEAMDSAAVQRYPYRWAAQQFGDQLAQPVADLISSYSRFSSRRKPELLDPALFAAYPDLKSMSGDYTFLNGQATEVGKHLAPEYQAAYFQLVQYPIAASANLYELYDAAADNQALVKADTTGSRETAIKANLAADIAERDFDRDAALAAQYNELLDGKWHHMMDQTHIGYSNWQQPDNNIMPKVERVAVDGVVPARNPKPADPKYALQFSMDDGPAVSGSRYVESGGYVAIEAGDATRVFEDVTAGVYWDHMFNLGRAATAVLSLPQTAPASDPAALNPMRLEYDIQTVTAGDATLHLYLAPTLDTAGQGGLRLAVTIDDRPQQVLNFDLKPDTPQWNKAVSDNVVDLTAVFNGLLAGPHTVRIFRIDGNIVVERVIVDMGGLGPSYLGPPESRLGSS